MKPQELYEAWAPRAAIWSAWAKPVLFHDISVNKIPSGVPEPQEPKRMSANDGQTALVIDLPGAAAIPHALLRARQGFRPVPLYNACTGPGELISLSDLIETLFDATPNVLALTLPDNAPPAFLIDSRRLDGTPVPSRFDNRWMVFPQDFPSATRLKSAGITTVIHVRADGEPPARDLALILSEWQKKGLAILADNIQDTLAPRPVTIHPPSLGPILFHRMLALLGLRKNSAGGFGSLVPEPSQSSGYG